MGAEGESPHWALALVDGEELATSLVLDQNGTIEQPNGQQLSIWGPVAGDAPGWGLGLVHALTVAHPEAEVNTRAGSEGLQHWVEAESLDLLPMCVLEKTLSLGRPDDYGIVSTT